MNDDCIHASLKNTTDLKGMPPSQQAIDWLLLWEHLSHAHTFYFQQKRYKKSTDTWTDKAAQFDEMVTKRWKKPDSTREFMRNYLGRHPGSTVLDIGAGTGAWSLFMAPHTRYVTALEPSESMRFYIQKKRAASSVDNIIISDKRWPDNDVPPHDIVFASHSMYGTPSLKAFVKAMEKTAVKACFMLMRVPFSNGLMAQAAMRVWGHPHDSPNFQVAYNALLDMGIFPNVLIETGSSWRPWSSPTLDHALADIKSRLNISGSTAHDNYLMGLLSNTLKKDSEGYTWPVANRSALVFWEFT